MHFNQWKTYIAAGLIFASSYVFATENPVHEQLQVPQCLAANITVPYKILAENKQFKIMDVSSDDLNTISHLADQVHCGRFVNVSHRLQGTLSTTKKQAALHLLRKKSLKTAPWDKFVYKIKYPQEVNLALSQVIPDNIWHTLIHLTSYYNRSATTTNGVQTAQWLKSEFETMAAAYARTDTATYFVATGYYKQPSLVTVIGKDMQEPGIVIGAHMDTLDGRMPGAGDDGSGSASIMEMARVLLASNNQFKRPIYIIWYAAEERGLVGSQYVVDYFKDQHIQVKAAIQFDMTGYRVDPQDPTMWVFTDHTDKRLSSYVARLIETYVKVPVDYSACGYGCSDHASWNDEGIPAAFPCESNFENHNPHIHSEADAMELLNLEHMTNFTKLALAFAIELASE